MLVAFSVANFLSFKDRQCLSMVASNGLEMRETHCLESTVKGIPDLLRSAVVHGPNAGGKSNLLRAMSTMRDLIVNGRTARNSKDMVPFQLSKESREAPSEFEVTFVSGEVRYQYGFTLDRVRYYEEWLVAYPSGRAQQWFHRIYDPSTSDYQVTFSDKFKGQKAVYKTATRPDALLLTTAIQLNNQQLLEPYGWIEKAWQVLGLDGSLMPWYTIDLCMRMRQTDRVKDFLNAADLSVLSFEFRESKAKFPENFPDFLREMFSKEVVLTHGQGEAAFEFELERDSQGTQKLFALVGPLLEVFDNGYVLAVDELCSSLHPLLLRHVVSRFHQLGCRAQLIFTNHDTTLLDPEFFRRDQVWFVSKNEHLASELYPLSDFHPRKEEAFGKGYLQGRYGALPFLKEVLNVEAAFS